MTIVRQILGRPNPAPPPFPPEYRLVTDRLNRQAARLRAIDAQIDTQRASSHPPRRRRGDSAMGRS